MTVRFSFKRSGDLVGPPRMTFATAGAPADVRNTYLKAINDSIDACTPLKFTGALGGALAGRPIAIRYVDNRDFEKKARIFSPVRRVSLFRTRAASAMRARTSSSRPA